MIDTVRRFIVDLYLYTSVLVAEHPKWASAVSMSAVLSGAWAYWNRSIINVRLGKREGSHAPVTVDIINEKREKIAQVEAKHFRVRIKNAGLTTIKNCSGQLRRVIRRVAGDKPAAFDGDEYHLGWAHHSHSDMRDIQPRQSHQMDVATLVLQTPRSNQLYIGGLNRSLPHTLRDFLSSYKGRATYTLDLLISADSGKPRQVFVELTFDPYQDELTFIPFNTRLPWWRLGWILRAHWVRRRHLLR
jgi:hypothetical protein